MVCQKYLIAIALFVIYCLHPLYAMPQRATASPAQSNQMALNLASLQMRPENNARHNELHNAGHDSLYDNPEQYRYEQKEQKSAPFEVPLNVVEDGVDGQQRSAKDGKIEKNDRSLVSSMLGLMGGLLKSHLRDDSHYTQFH